jgi:hypothetical protein
MDTFIPATPFGSRLASDGTAGSKVGAVVRIAAAGVLAVSLLLSGRDGA